jgi:hypothetical protein
LPAPRLNPLRYSLTKNLTGNSGVKGARRAGNRKTTRLSILRSRGEAEQKNGRSIELCSSMQLHGPRTTIQAGKRQVRLYMSVGEDVFTIIKIKIFLTRQPTIMISVIWSKSGYSQCIANFLGFAQTTISGILHNFKKSTLSIVLHIG